MPRKPGDPITEYRYTCPYWVRGPVHRMLTIVYGCGGYGEVSRNHPAASMQITTDPNGPYICKRCKGTGNLEAQKRG